MNDINFTLTLDNDRYGRVTVDRYGEAVIYTDYPSKLLIDRYYAIVKAAKDFAAWIRRNGGAGAVRGATYEDGIHLDLA